MIIAGSMSTIEADCKAYGGTGFYNQKHCQEYGIKLLEKCAHSNTCKGCGTYATCPNGGTEDTCLALAENNKLSVENEDRPGTYTLTEFQCVSLLNKPSSGMGILGSGIVGDMDI